MSTLQFKSAKDILAASKKFDGEDRVNLEEIAILIRAKDFANAKRESDRLDTMLREECFEPQPSNIPDALNSDFLFSCTATDLLTQIVNGLIDPKELAWKELRNRGKDANGLWVGFNDNACKKPF